MTATANTNTYPDAFADGHATAMAIAITCARVGHREIR